MQTSLCRDRSDIAKLRHGYEVHEGHRLNGSVPTYYPFFFTRESATWHSAGLYRNGAAFLIGGGPSFGDVPCELLARVWTMTMNNGVHSFRSQANCTVDDPGRFNLSTWLDPAITKFVPMAHFEKPLWDNRLLWNDGQWVQMWEPANLRAGDCPNVIGYRRNEKFHAPRWLHEDTINWGNHGKYGGGRSVMLAALRILFLLGFRRVYLLGIDFDMTPEKRYHFDEDRTPASIRGNMATYAKLEKWLAQLQPYFLKEKFIVQNCNPTSKLTAFPFLPFEEAIDEATGHLGDYANERTTGMYRKWDEKLAEIGRKPEAGAEKVSGASSEAPPDRARETVDAPTRVRQAADA